MSAAYYWSASIVRESSSFRHCTLHRSGRRGPRPVAVESSSHDPMPIHGSLAELEPLRLVLVEKSESAVWRQLIQRFHYRGCRTPFGPVTFCPTSLTA